MIPLYGDIQSPFTSPDAGIDNKWDIGWMEGSKSVINLFGSSSSDKLPCRC